MAEFQPAIQKTLQNEGGFYQNPVTGEVVNFGITHWFLRTSGLLPPNNGPATEGEVAYVKSLTASQAQGIYLQYFWLRPGYDKIPDSFQEVADKTFDLQVNTGHGTRFLQQALNTCRVVEQKLDSPDLVVDGSLGPKTLEALALYDPSDVLAALRTCAEIYYKEIAERDPKKHANDLAGWLARLQKA